jgi:tetratricopeptide (TPR) repeat protein
VLDAESVVPVGAVDLATRRQLAEAPRDPGLLTDYGNLLVRAGSYDAARTAYEAASGAAPSAVMPLYDLGLLELEQGRPAEAIRHFRRALDVDPAFARAEYGLGAAFEARGRNHRAVKHYVRAFRLAPDLLKVEHNPEVLFNTLADWASTKAYLESSVGRGTRLYANPQPIVSLLLPAAVATEAPAGPPAAAGDE